MDTTHTMNSTQRFWDRLAERYAAKPVPDPSIYERKLAMTRERLTPEARVLELGCGTGSTAIALAPFAGQILATDFSAAMIDIAREKARVAGIDNVEFRQLAVDASPMAPGSVDAVLTHSLLHLLPDWRAVLTRAHAALVPGGMLVMSTMCLRDGYSFMRFIAPLGRRLGLLPHLSFFSRNELESAIADTGFELEQSWLPGAKRGVFHIARKAS